MRPTIYLPSQLAHFLLGGVDENRANQSRFDGWIEMRPASPRNAA